MSVLTLSGPRSFATICKWVLIAAAAQLISLTAASATGCLPLMDRAPPLELDMFAQDTSRVLDYAQSDDDKLEDKLTVYLATNPELITAIKDLLIKAPAPRHYVIGKAMGRAALHCGAIEPAYTRKIFTFVSELRDSDVLAGYTSVETSNGVQLGTIGKAGPAGSGASALFEGEFGTELANPFAEVPLPQ
jgi:hypothetical protein